MSTTMNVATMTIEQIAINDMLDFNVQTYTQFYFVLTDDSVVAATDSKDIALDIAANYAAKTTLSTLVVEATARSYDNADNVYKRVKQFNTNTTTFVSEAG